MRLLAAQSLGLSFVNADAAADFLRVKNAEVKAQAAGLFPSDPGSVKIDISSIGAFEGFRGHLGIGQALQISVTDADIADFRQAVDVVRAALSAAGVSRARLDELNAFPDLGLADTVGELVPRIENLLRIYDQTVRGIAAPTRPSALPIAAGISIAFIAIGAVIFYFVTRKGG